MGTTKHSTRRDFLFGKAAADALTDAVAPIVSDPANSATELVDPGQRRGYLLNVQRRAMACDFEIQFPADPGGGATEHALAALDLIERLEDRLTVYRDDSEVIRINQLAAERPVEVEPGLFALLELAARLARDTEGAFDFTTGPLLRAWGFFRRAGRLPGEGEIVAALEQVGFQNVLLEAGDQTVAFSQPGTEIHLNSIGKGYALDAAAQLLADRGVANALLQGGKSSVLARGSSGEAPGWRVGLRHPLFPQRRLAEFALCGEALATSGSATQFFRHAGRRYGHILDPRTGWPAEAIYSATVIAPSAAEADALSTAFYVMGPEGVEPYCADRPQLRALLVCPTRQEGEVQVHTFGMERADWRVD